MKAKRTLLVLLATAACAAFAFQQQPRKYVMLDDKKGSFKIYDVESFLGSFVEDGDYKFEATGAPIRGYSQEQGLTFSMRALNGVASRTANGSFRIEDGRASGNVVADLVSKSGGGESKSHITSGSMTIAESADQTTITFPGAFTFSNNVTTSATNRSLELKAPSGTFVLPLLDNASNATNPFRSANVRGPVDVTVDDRRTGASGVTRHFLKVRANVMTYNGATRTLRLEGNLTADMTITQPDGKVYEPTMQGDWVAVVLDENSALVRVDVGAGTMTVKDGGGR